MDCVPLTFFDHNNSNNPLVQATCTNEVDTGFIQFEEKHSEDMILYWINRISSQVASNIQCPEETTDLFQSLGPPFEASIQSGSQVFHQGGSQETAEPSFIDNQGLKHYSKISSDLALVMGEPCQFDQIPLFSVANLNISIKHDIRPILPHTPLPDFTSRPSIKNPKTWACYTCRVTFVSRNKARRHAKKGNNAFPCNRCHKQFARKDHRNAHASKCMDVSTSHRSRTFQSH